MTINDAVEDLSAAELPALQECQERSLYSSRQKLPLWRLGSFQQCQVGAGLDISLFLFSLPPSWWYNWRVTPNQEKTPPEDFCTCSSGSCGPPPPGKQFIPMITGYLEEDKPWMDDINDPVDDQYDIILGFNEPNRPDHSDIPPEVAASAWIELQNIYPDKVNIL